MGHSANTSLGFKKFADIVVGRLSLVDSFVDFVIGISLMVCCE